MFRALVPLLLALLAGSIRAEGPVPEPAPAPTPDARADWIGTWAVFDGHTDLVNVVVLEDGRASTTRVDPTTGVPDAGTWQATPTALYLRYGRGRGETIVRHGLDHRHVVRLETGDGGFETVVGSAFRLSGPFAELAGAWRRPPGSGTGALVLRSDGTATRLDAVPRTGSWRRAAGGAALRWDDAEPELVALGGSEHRLLAKPPAKNRDGEE